MQLLKPDMITRLKRSILTLQGLKKTPGSTTLDLGLGMMEQAFPDHRFPLGAVHEFGCTGTGDKTATAGFIAGILAALMKRGGVAIWIASSRTIFPPALAGFGIEPDKIIFIDLAREKEMLWVMEEALKCEGLAAVVGEIHQLDFTASRRLQLAVEQSRVTGFVIRQTPRLNTTACVSRWRITAAASSLPNGMPGVGFPRWHVELLKIRNGRPGTWHLEWKNRSFHQIIEPVPTVYEADRKIV